MSSIVRNVLRVGSRVAPPVAAEVGYGLWDSLGSPERVHPRDLAVHEAAAREDLVIDGRSMATYRWGTGPQVILLVHGWRSRASRFAPLVARLASSERTILSFDAPGHGDSPGTRTDILDYMSAIRVLVERYGVPEAIIGHSFGALSAFVAVKEGVPVRGIVSIAGMADSGQLVSTFAQEAGITGPALEGLRRRIAARNFPGVPDPWRRFRAEIDAAHAHVPLLIVHDRDDPRSPMSNPARMAAWHPGSVATVLSSGLGHNRVVTAPSTLDAIEEFLARISAAAHAVARRAPE